jgi:hypothetical protein
MFVFKTGVNQSRVLHNFLITIICRLFQPADLPQPVYSYAFYPNPFLLRAVIITSTYGHDDRISIPEVRETIFSPLLRDRLKFLPISLSLSLNMVQPYRPQMTV